MEVVASCGFTASGNTPVRLVIEGLLAHFFSPDRPSYVQDDVVWFLKFANKQEQWCFNANPEKVDSEIEPVADASVSLFAVSSTWGIYYFHTTL